MKIHIIVGVYSVLLFSTTVFGQKFVESTTTSKNSERKLFQLGFKYGIVNNNLSGSEVDFKTKSGSTTSGLRGKDIGLNIKLWFVKFLYLRLEMNTIEKGGEISGGGFVYNDIAEFKYRNIPILLGVNIFPESLPIDLSAEIGWSFNAEINSNENLEMGLHPSNIIDRNRNIRSFNIGLNFEADLTKRLSIFLNYRSYKDSKYFFKRNYITWEYDLWHDGSTIASGLFFNIRK